MKADIINLIEECPEGCACADVSIEDTTTRTYCGKASVNVIVDCSHREACAMWKKDHADSVDQVAREAVGTLMHLCACLSGIDKIIDVSEVDSMYDALLSLGIEVDV